MMVGRFATILRETFQETDLDRCIPAFLEEKFGSGWFDRLPINVVELAADCGFPVRQVSQLPSAGVLSALNDGEILISSADIPQRKRFTTAHEIGHYLIRGLDRKYAMSSPLLADDEEAVCDLIASHILVPSAVASDCQLRRHPSFAVAEQIQRKYDISLLAALVTMAQRSASQFHVAIWEESSNESLSLVWIVASKEYPDAVWIPRGYQLNMDKMVTRWALGYLGDQPTDTLVLRLNGERYYYDASYRRYGHSPTRILALLSDK